MITVTANKNLKKNNNNTEIYIYIYIYTYIAMINPSNAPQTIVTLPQMKDMLATTTATIVKIKARTNNT